MLIPDPQGVWWTDGSAEPDCPENEPVGFAVQENSWQGPGKEEQVAAGREFYSKTERAKVGWGWVQSQEP